MNKKEKEQMIEVFERLTKIETLMTVEFRHLKESIEDSKKSLNVLNGEHEKLIDRMERLEDRQGKVEDKLRGEIKRWKICATLASPAITFIIVELVKKFLGI